jgi:cytochrome c-type biogenesis protein CcmH
MTPHAHSVSLLVGLLIAAAPLSPELERQARELEATFIAPCCWSQQVSVHQSPAADSIREDVRRRLARGETRQQIIDDYVVQFGERILVQPPARGYKVLLYVFPPIALLVTAAGVALVVRRATHRRNADAAPTTAAPAPPAAYDSQLDRELEDLD